MHVRRCCRYHGKHATDNEFVRGNDSRSREQDKIALLRAKERTRARAPLIANIRRNCNDVLHLSNTPLTYRVILVWWCNLNSEDSLLSGTEDRLRFEANQFLLQLPPMRVVFVVESMVVEFFFPIFRTKYQRETNSAGVPKFPHPKSGILSPLETSWNRESRCFSGPRLEQCCEICAGSSWRVFTRESKNQFQIILTF